jgi:hypothetical protein
MSRFGGLSATVLLKIFIFIFQRAQQLMAQDEEEDEEDDNEMQEDDEPDKASFDEEVERNTEANGELTAGGVGKPNGITSTTGR